MKPLTDEMLRQMTEVVVREVNPVAVILFGSCATGTADPHSDVDLMVIQNEPFGPGRDRFAEMVRLWHVLAGFEVAKDILVFSRQEVEERRHSRNHIIGTALREGRFLYGSV